MPLPELNVRPELTAQRDAFEGYISGLELLTLAYKEANKQIPEANFGVIVTALKDVLEKADELVSESIEKGSTEAEVSKLLSSIRLKVKTALHEIQDDQAEITMNGQRQLVAVGALRLYDYVEQRLKLSRDLAARDKIVATTGNPTDPAVEAVDKIVGKDFQAISMHPAAQQLGGLTQHLEAKLEERRIQGKSSAALPDSLEIKNAAGAEIQTQLLPGEREALIKIAETYNVPKDKLVWLASDSVLKLYLDRVGNYQGNPPIRTDVTGPAALLEALRQLDAQVIVPEAYDQFAPLTQERVRDLQQVLDAIVNPPIAAEAREGFEAMVKNFRLYNYYEQQLGHPEGIAYDDFLSRINGWLQAAEISGTLPDVLPLLEEDLKKAKEYLLAYQSSLEGPGGIHSYDPETQRYFRNLDAAKRQFIERELQKLEALAAKLKVAEPVRPVQTAPVTAAEVQDRIKQIEKPMDNVSSAWNHYFDRIFELGQDAFRVYLESLLDELEDQDSAWDKQTEFSKSDVGLKFSLMESYLASIKTDKSDPTKQQFFEQVARSYDYLKYRLKYIDLMGPLAESAAGSAKASEAWKKFPEFGKHVMDFMINNGKEVWQFAPEARKATELIDYLMRTTDRLRIVLLDENGQIEMTTDEKPKPKNYSLRDFSYYTSAWMGGQGGNYGKLKDVMAHIFEGRFVLKPDVETTERPNPQNYPGGINDEQYKRDLSFYSSEVQRKAKEEPNPQDYPGGTNDEQYKEKLRLYKLAKSRDAEFLQKHEFNDQLNRANRILNVAVPAGAENADKRKAIARVAFCTYLFSWGREQRMLDSYAFPGGASPPSFFELTSVMDMFPLSVEMNKACKGVIEMPEVYTGLKIDRRWLAKVAFGRKIFEYLRKNHDDGKLKGISNKFDNYLMEEFDHVDEKELENLFWQIANDTTSGDEREASTAYTRFRTLLRSMYYSESIADFLGIKHTRQMHLVDENGNHSHHGNHLAPAVLTPLNLMIGAHAGFFTKHETRLDSVQQKVTDFWKQYHERTYHHDAPKLKGGVGNHTEDIKTLYDDVQACMQFSSKLRSGEDLPNWREFAEGLAYRTRVAFAVYRNTYGDDPTTTYDRSIEDIGKQKVRESLVDYFLQRLDEEGQLLEGFEINQLVHGTVDGEEKSEVIRFAVTYPYPYNSAEDAAKLAHLEEEEHHLRLHLKFHSDPATIAELDRVLDELKPLRCANLKEYMTELVKPTKAHKNAVHTTLYTAAKRGRNITNPKWNALVGLQKKWKIVMDFNNFNLMPGSHGHASATAAQKQDVDKSKISK